METAPRDGTQILCTDGHEIRVCYPKTFPRPISILREQGRFGKGEIAESMAGDTWEYFRDDENAPGHSWNMIPTYWMPLPKLPRGSAMAAMLKTIDALP